MYQYIDTQDTIVALATASGLGAIAVIRVSGAQTFALVGRFFKGKNLAAQPSHTVHLGYLLDEAQEPVDQVLVTIFKNPNSYTGEDIAEISCHGSPYIQQRIIELFVRNGARLAREGEFTLRAFLNRKLDLSQAEAVADLIHAQSATSHELALKQLRGGFSNEIAQLRERLIHFASLIELELDFGEEDVEFANRAELKQLVSNILKRLWELAESFRLGNALKNGIATVIAGRPNAGKSTLLNALLNEERAIVSEIAGTTRDTIEEALIINGIRFRLTDTAGIREATDQIERIGVERTMEKIQQAAILIYVYDAVGLSPDAVRGDLAQLRRDSFQLLVLANKLDACPPDFALPDLGEGVEIIGISAKDKTQLEAVRTALVRFATQGKTQLDSTIVTNARHYEALHNAADSLQKVLDGLHSHITGDFLAMDIRQALRYLGEITGQVDVEDLLENIFSKFCIGK